MPNLAASSPAGLSTNRREAMLDGADVQTTNGLDLDALGKVVEAIENDACKAKVRFDVTTRWTGQTRSETTGRRLHHRRRARSTAAHKIVADEPVRAARRRQRAQPAGAADGGVQRLHHGRLCRRRLGARASRSTVARDPHPRRARPARLPRPQRRTCRPATRTIDYEVRITGDGIARAVRGDPPERDQDLAQRLQRQPARSA